MKKTAAATPVDFDRKFDEPVAPNRLPDAPEPKAAPMSAPFPCCSRTKPMMVRADRTWMMTIMVSSVFMMMSPISKVTSLVTGMNWALCGQVSAGSLDDGDEVDRFQCGAADEPTIDVWHC